MKNEKINPAQKLLDLSLGFILLISFFLLNGCQKDETPYVNNGDVTTTNDMQNARVSKNNNEGPFALLLINHSAARTNLPDYSVTVMSDGAIIFNGRRNTRFIGTHKYSASSSLIDALTRIYVKNRFSEIEELPFIFDLPSNSTSFRMDANSEIITRLDYNNPASNKLINLRIKTEELLKISHLVYKDRNWNDITLLKTPAID